jgi:hypothetical protein
MRSSSISILGEGTVSADSKADLRSIYDDFIKEGLLKPVKQFGRFSLETQRVFLAASMALHDANLFDKVPPGTGILHTSADGALADNLVYFKDYLAGGRKLARANLFIYTLPTSPLGETAIHFNLNGPLYHIAAPVTYNREIILAEAHSLIENEAAPMMLAVISTPDQTTCLVTGTGIPGKTVHISGDTL